MITNTSEIIFLACSQFICRDCFNKSLSKEQCFFCKQSGFQKNHVVNGNYFHLALKSLLESKQICDECDEIMTWNDCNSHQCPKEIVSCVCNLKLARENLNFHQKFHCCQRMIECFLCKKTHKIIDDCINMKVICFHCDRKISQNSFEHHIETKHIRCPNMDCSFIGKKIKKHIRYCPFYPIMTCQLCFQHISCCLMKNHQENVCLMRQSECKHCLQITTIENIINKHLIQVKCKYCSQNVEPRCQLFLHEESCHMKKVDCIQCNFQFFQFDIFEHIKNNCLKRKILCLCCNQMIIADQNLIHKQTDCQDFFEKCSVSNCLFQTKRKDISNEHKCPQTTSNVITFSFGEIVDYQPSSKFEYGCWISVRIIDKLNDNNNYLLSTATKFLSSSLITVSEFDLLNYSQPYQSVRKYSIFTGRIFYIMQNLIWHKAIVLKKTNFDFRYCFVLDSSKKNEITIEKKEFDKHSTLQSHGYFTASDFEIGHIFRYEKSCFKVIAQDFDGLLLEEFGRMSSFEKKFLQFSYVDCFRKLLPLKNI